MPKILNFGKVGPTRTTGLKSRYDPKGSHKGSIFADPKALDKELQEIEEEFVEEFPLGKAAIESLEKAEEDVGYQEGPGTFETLYNIAEREEPTTVVEQIGQDVMDYALDFVRGEKRDFADTAPDALTQSIRAPTPDQIVSKPGKSWTGGSKYQKIGGRRNLRRRVRA